MRSNFNVDIRRIPAFRVATLAAQAPFTELGDEVRKQWQQVQRMVPEIHPERLDADIGYVLSPQWTVAEENGNITLKVGVKVSSWHAIPGTLERIEIPEQVYAVTRFQGDRERLSTIYDDLFAWLDRNGYERNTVEGAYWMEMNRLKPVNPFDIPFEEIQRFDYDIAIAIMPK
ncbi:MULTISPECIES: GyrI-like domain-containing protein [Paenibacillus]|uniref:Transcriptional regulator YdeE n=1 Tax=Paenibacillus brasilensis TaxID=128574 RepID=A0ABU0KYN9_9BACL|nr:MULTISPECIES: GyrI-like domain-containing protein [Paenibacillus]MDQ0494567.1 putative transcriptional regulator YdeE [Paenibacillus brasilensis]